jgi:4-diphosphocytidyl-2-C-methyl-D-erythritol kinase
METTGMDLVIRSPAKINWTLRVLGRRPDGYHEIESLVSAVTLYDELAFTSRTDGRFVLTCDQPAVPTDERNLICRAAGLISADAGPVGGLNCRLTKRIPVGGGLGGGSSNGASALRALNRLWGLNWPAGRLMDAAAKLGSDVPFFIRGGTALIRGRGEQVEPATLPWQGWIVLLLPELAVSTAEVYRAWRPPAAPTIAGEYDDRTGRIPPAVRWMSRAYNMLEKPAMEVCPALKELVDRAESIINRPVRISGSGSTLYTAFDSEREAEESADLFGRSLQLRICVVQVAEST